MPLGLNGALGAVAPKHVVEGWESDNQAKLWIPYLIFRRKIDQEDAMWLSMVEAQQYAQVQKQHYSCATLMDAVSVLIFSCCCFQKIFFLVWWFSLLCKALLLGAIVLIGMKYEINRPWNLLYKNRIGPKEIFKWTVLRNGKRFLGKSNSWW